MNFHILTSLGCIIKEWVQGELNPREGTFFAILIGRECRESLERSAVLDRVALQAFFANFTLKLHLALNLVGL